MLDGVRGQVVAPERTGGQHTEIHDEAHDSFVAFGAVEFLCIETDECVRPPHGVGSSRVCVAGLFARGATDSAACDRNRLGRAPAAVVDLVVRGAVFVLFVSSAVDSSPAVVAVVRPRAVSVGAVSGTSSSRFTGAAAARRP